MDKGAEGFWFHEGGEPHDRARDYLYRNGRMYCGMTNLAIQFADVGPGDGGFACLPGSHKSNYPCPDEIRLYEAHQDRVVQPVARAGDVMIFVETLMHGSLPWRGEHQRRTAILRYNNGVTANSMMGTWTPPEFFEELTDAQNAVVSAPHHRGPADAHEHNSLPCCTPPRTKSSTTHAAQSSVSSCFTTPGNR